MYSRYHFAFLYHLCNLNNFSLLCVLVNEPFKEKLSARCTLTHQVGLVICRHYSERRRMKDRYLKSRPPSGNGIGPVQLFRPISGLLSRPRSNFLTSVRFTILSFICPVYWIERFGIQPTYVHFTYYSQSSYLV